MAVMSTTACATTFPLAVVAAGGPGGVVGLTAVGWVLVVILALVAGVTAHGLIAWAQHRVPVATITLVQPAQPALGTLWAALFLGEVVTPVQLAGISVVVVSIAVIVRCGPR
jgi:drug/metabolite transporter (DMT)-like permease